MTITRHFVDVGARRVHYRRAGSGPALLMAHQSPRSSAELEPLMARWAAHFTCIAPDTPGFGQSDPLPGEPEIDDFADATVGFLDALGLGRAGGFGFHSGGIILMAALRRAPARFTALAIGGYAVWTEDERRLFGDAYLPPFRPSAYGEHLAWAWHRVLEQSWVFPWFDLRQEARLSVAHADLAKVDATIRDLLEAGDAYRAGYGAVLRAPRGLPPPKAAVPPVLIAAYAGDPLQPHIDRLGALPTGWRAEKVATPAALESAALAHLRTHPSPDAGPAVEAADEGFVAVPGGLLHWRGSPAARVAVLHAPGAESSALPSRQEYGIDLPGHGLSDDLAGDTLDDWVEAVVAALPDTVERVVGVGLSALLALAVAERVGLEGGGRDALIPGDSGTSLLPDLTPDRFGAYLHRAWGVARAERFFWPWHDTARPIPLDTAGLAPEALARRHRGLIRARAGHRLARLLLAADRHALPAPTAGWTLPTWAEGRDDIWRPRERS